MLRLILGRSGSGKTHWIRNKIKELAESGNQKILLVVPEQYTFESERALLQLLGESLFPTVQVVSFTRLSDFVFRQTGGLAGRRLDDGGRAILMSLALEEVKDMLTLYRRESGTIEMVHLMLEAEKEFKMCSVPPDGLLKTADSLEQGNLQKKMREAALILQTYEALVTRSYVDPMDDLTRLADTLREHPCFGGYTVLVDAFHGFTGQESKVLECILTQAEDCYVSLCLDPSQTKGEELFAPVQRTESQLKRMANKHSIPIAVPIRMNPGIRFRGAGLRVLEQQVYRREKRSSCAAVDDVSIYCASSPYDEADYVARTIRKLVMNEGYRYREIEVIARSTDRYQGILDHALQKYEIPYFMDEAEMLDTKPLMNLLLSAFDIVTKGWNSDELFRYLKTGLAGLDMEEISLLENYVLLWSISGRKWREPFTAHPDGFSPAFSEEDRQRLCRLEQLRLRAVEPLVRFSARVRDATGEQIASSCYRLLEEIESPKHLKRLADALEEEGAFGLAEEQLRLWDLLMEILDQTALVLADHTIAPQRYAELLKLVINSGDIAFIPQGLDQVTVGSADHTRSADPKVVFLIGAVDGEFPRAPVSSGIFNDTERRLLIGMGLPLYDSLEQLAVEERYLAYLSMASPSERLYLSYYTAGGSGSAKSPSSLVREMLRILPEMPRTDSVSLDLRNTVWAKRPAFEQTARFWSADSRFSETLKRYFTAQPEYASRLKAIRRAALSRPVKFEHPTNAKRLFGEQMKVSASQVEKFYLCRFQYFCRYGLRAKERRPATFDALEYGSLMHFLLEQALKSHTPEQWEALGRPQAKQEIEGYLEQYVQTYLGGWQDKTPRFRYLFSRLTDTAELLLSHMVKELGQSDFQPEDYELSIQQGGDISPLVIRLPGGGTVEVDGKVDRVDVMRRHGKSYVRVIDYKTGVKEFKLSDVLYGLNMQMLLYLAAIWKNGGERYGDVVPAGVLYMPANRPTINTDRKNSEETDRKELGKKLRMNGLVLDDPEVISGMEHKAQGVFIPVALKDGKPAKTEAVASLSQMGRIVKHMESLVIDMAIQLRAGEIPAVPVSGEYEACAWCPYRPVCGREEQGPARLVEKQSRDQVMKQLEQDEGRKD
ncbi:MAG: helicase [Clostridiales bacterium]|jgi:ATP-dependent helicase/nuclease subunit B|nr:helicase [Clostridiales bacterium]